MKDVSSAMRSDERGEQPPRADAVPPAYGDRLCRCGHDSRDHGDPPNSGCRLCQGCKHFWAFPSFV